MSKTAAETKMSKTDAETKMSKTDAETETLIQIQSLQKL